MHAVPPPTASLVDNSVGVAGGGLGRGSTRAKPTFLKQLQEFVADELALVGCETVGPPCAERLQVYREAFTFFIEDFRTYKPILSAIKAEYEGMLDKYAQRLHFIPPLQARLSTLRTESNQVQRQ